MKLRFTYRILLHSHSDAITCKIDADVKKKMRGFKKFVIVVRANAVTTISKFYFFITTPKFYTQNSPKKVANTPKFARWLLTSASTAHARHKKAFHRKCCKRGLG